MLKINLKSYLFLGHYSLIILYKIIIDLIYILNVSSKYYYNGMVFNPSLYKYIFSLLIFIFSINFVIRLYNKVTPSSLIIVILYYLYFIPGCTIYSMAGLSDLYFIFFILYWIFFLSLYLNFPNFTIPNLKESITSNLFYVFFIIVILGSLVIVGLYNDFNFNFSLSNVYELRFKQREMNLPTIVKYFQPTASSLLPLFLIYFLIKRKTKYIILIVFADLLLFSFGGAKGTIFTLFIALLAYFYYKPNRVRWIVTSLLSLNLISFLEKIIYSKSYITIYIQNRVLFIPNLLSFQYYDFFSMHELLYLRNSILIIFGV